MVFEKDKVNGNNGYSDNFTLTELTEEHNNGTMPHHDDITSNDNLGNLLSLKSSSLSSYAVDLLNSRLQLPD